MSPAHDPWAQIPKLRRKLRERQRKVQDGLERNSALPASVFECQEPMVEAALMDAAASLFLAQMTQATAAGEETTGSPPPINGQDVVGPTEIQQCLGRLAGLASDPVPDPLADIDDERLWILVDLARNGSGLSRQRATAALRTVLRDQADGPESELKRLQRLVEGLTGLVADDSCPVVFKALLVDARGSLKRIRDATEEVRP